MLTENEGLALFELRWDLDLYKQVIRNIASYQSLSRHLNINVNDLVLRVYGENLKINLVLNTKNQPRQIDVTGFSNLWLYDQSNNPTGTHKDWMALYILMNYRDMLEEKSASTLEEKLHQISMISSGSAAFSIQTQLKKYRLPNLKVLIDKETASRMISTLESIGCEVYRADLKEMELQSNDILRLTENPDGIDATSYLTLDHLLGRYSPLISNKHPTVGIGPYFSICIDILNRNPEFVFVPYGTGQLFENFLRLNDAVLTNFSLERAAYIFSGIGSIKEYIDICKRYDAVFEGDRDYIRECNFIGATTTNPNTKAQKLFAHYRPYTISDNMVSELKSKGYIGQSSQVQEFDEDYLNQAQKIAERQKIIAEPSGLGGLALLLQMQDKMPGVIPKDSRIIVVNTGKLKLQDY